MKTYAKIKVTDNLSWLEVNLAQEQNRNALSLQVLQELLELLKDVENSQRIKVVVLSATGSTFCSGHDLNELVGRTEHEYRDLFNLCSTVMLKLRNLSQVVVAKVQGHAFAAGCQLVAECDLAYASENALFATPGMKIGLFCSTPMVPLVRRVPSRLAFEMLITGEPITAAQASEANLINRAVPESKLDEEVNHVVSQITKYPLDVISIGKSAFCQVNQDSDLDVYNRLTESMSSNAMLPNAQEGICAFLEKRTADWKSQSS